MRKKLAIKGHSTRGNEVIELLEMLGGENSLIISGCNLSGYEPFNLYYINDNGVINYKHHSLNKDMIVFTLEEFLEKFPFKVGDVIRFTNDIVEEIAEMELDEELEDIIYTSVSGVKRTCQVPKNTIYGYGSTQRFDKDCSSNTPKTVEEKINQENVETKIESNKFHVSMGKIASVIFNNANYEDEVELQLEDYEIEFRDGKIYAVKKKPKYPKTYKECFNVCFGNKHHIIQVVGLDGLGDNKELFESFIKLKICRDAYLKIYGEQMGLGKPWEPDFNSGQFIPAIIYRGGFIQKVEVQYINTILAFPTTEMREAFFENFKKEIEQCKELL